MSKLLSFHGVCVQMMSCVGRSGCLKFALTIVHHCLPSAIPGPLSLTWFKFNPNIHKKSHPLQSVGLNYLSTPKLQRVEVCEWVYPTAYSTMMGGRSDIGSYIPMAAKYDMASYRERLMHYNLVRISLPMNSFNSLLTLTGKMQTSVICAVYYYYPYLCVSVIRR